MKIESERLILCPMENDAMKTLIERERDPVLKQAYAEMLAGCMNDPKNRIWYAVWTLALKDHPGVIAGDLSFKGPPESGSVELGYGLREGFCGHGYMTEAVKTVSRWALTQKGVTAVEAETAPENTASQKVLRRAGYAPTGKTGEEGPRFSYRLFE